MKLYAGIEAELRDEVMKSGGSISHHHGVGKLRKQFIDRSISPAAIQLSREMKKAMDPKNIFASNNTFPTYLEGSSSKGPLIESVEIQR